MPDYRLYAHKNSYAMTTHLLLEELGVEYAAPNKRLFTSKTY